MFVGKVTWLLSTLMTSIMVSCFLENPSGTPLCSCEEYYINCVNRGLTVLPMIMTGVGFSSEGKDTNDLCKTNFTFIPDTRLWLNHNRIRNISDNAFRGLESKLTELDLSDNQLTSVPAALRLLTHLEILDLRQNPISSIAPFAFEGVRKSVLKLSIDLELFSTWPEELSLLENVQDISLNKLNIATVPDDAFSNWTQLQGFYLSETRLETMPRALCNVNRTFALIISHNTVINSGANFFKTCNKSTISQPFVTRIILEDNNLERISNIITSFPEMTLLYITNNPLLRLISNEEVPSNSNITVLNLRNNSFNRFPVALQKLTNLKELDLSFNNIQLLQRHALDGLTQLRRFKLSNNPLYYVSGDAFNAAVLLCFIDFESTNLTTIPQALSVAQNNILGINLAYSPIECSCSMLPWLKAWIQAISGLFGYCANESTPISDFISNQLPNCTY